MGLDDYHGEMIQKYIWRDELKVLPRIIEIMDEYDLTRCCLEFKKAK